MTFHLKKSSFVNNILYAVLQKQTECYGHRLANNVRMLIFCFVSCRFPKTTINISKSL